MTDWALIITKFPFLIFVIFRITGIMIVAPLFGSRQIPRRIRATLAIVLGLAILPVVPTAGLVLPSTAAGYLVAVVAELAVGFVLGFVASLLFIGVQMGGHIVGQQMGMALANVIDPLSNQQISVVEQAKFMFAVTLFLLAKGHHLLLAAVVGTFQTIPLMGLTYQPELLTTVGDTLFGEIFIVAVKVSAPAVAALMLTSVAMAFIARSVPEMNIFNIGFALRLAMGLVMISLTVPALAHLMITMFDSVAGNVNTLTRMMEATP